MAPNDTAVTIAAEDVDALRSFLLERIIELGPQMVEAAERVQAGAEVEYALILGRTTKNLFGFGQALSYLGWQRKEADEDVTLRTSREGMHELLLDARENPETAALAERGLSELEAAA